MPGSDSRIGYQRGGRYTMSAPASIMITPVFDPRRARKSWSGVSD
jgi:hypothetical protein